MPSFEDLYLRLRTIERRVYEDEVVKDLPFLHDGKLKKIPSISKEWKVRSRSTQKLIRYLTKRPPDSVLEIGCGNGWLSHHLATTFRSADVLATDINEFELTQARRVFGNLHHHLTFRLADIFENPLEAEKFDCIIIAGTLQYFADLTKLINTLLDLLTPRGEIHLVDSPIYRLSEVNDAKRRSETYFDSCGCPEMKEFYHHHSWTGLEGFNYRIIYDPVLLWNRLGQKIKNDSPFPWVIIAH
ncbi:MAG TPA: class I SAM-dependent methyltransferase [Cyclobacteriaceae bacterium]|nr:class I SAM-dependent methyltransferase [Cyclobacteriaceae bacterium]